MSSDKNSVAIIGFHDGAAGQVETWFESVTGLAIECFIADTDDFREVNIEEENKKRVCKTTDFPQVGIFKSRPLIASTHWIELIQERGISKVLSLEPDNQRRHRQIAAIRQSNLTLVSAIHPSALILSNAVIEEGVWINAGCIIGYKAEIKAGVLLNTGVRVDHHNVLQECSQLDPGVVTAGNVVLESCCHVHTGAVLINRVRIGKNAVVGAGAVVLKDVPPDHRAIGVPARCTPLQADGVR